MVFIQVSAIEEIYYKFNQLDLQKARENNFSYLK